jgi:hypothetical protein
MTWRRAVVADDGTHHVVDARPLYAARFRLVQRFHEPGLAPVIDDSGAYHVDATGSPAYSARFRQAWGFYEHRAAVEDATGWFHIHPDGSPVYMARHSWCGNFQEERCTVRDRDGRYFHIDLVGAPLYPERHRYAGDFRDGAAVIRSSDGDLCTHIDGDGRPLHGQWFMDLDVYHKGFARARDRRGWFHVDQHGVEAYQARFREVEPFYNGQAKVTTLGGDIAVIDQTGAVRLIVCKGEFSDGAKGPREQPCC